MAVSLVYSSPITQQIGTYPPSGSWPWGIGNTGTAVVPIPGGAAAGDVMIVALFGRRLGSYVATPFTLAGAGWTALGDHSTPDTAPETFAWEHDPSATGTYKMLQRTRVVSRVLAGGDTGPTITVGFGYSGVGSGGSSHYGHEYWVGVYRGGTWVTGSDVLVAQSTGGTISAPTGASGVALWVQGNRGFTNWVPTGVWAAPTEDRLDTGNPLYFRVYRGDTVVPASAPATADPAAVNPGGITGLLLPCPPLGGLYAGRSGGIIGAGSGIATF